MKVMRIVLLKRVPLSEIHYIFSNCMMEQDIGGNSAKPFLEHERGFVLIVRTGHGGIQQALVTW